MAISTAAALMGAGFLNSAGGVFSSLINAANQQGINEANVGLQYAINADQIEAARMNNETAIALANTAHQREVQDLRDAGLNPILSASGNGASTPQLDTPGLGAPQLTAPHMDNPLSSIASAMQQAIQVDDAHKLNEARYKLMGLPDDPKSLARFQDLLSDRTFAQAYSARAQAEADEAEQELRYLKAQLEKRALTDLSGEYPRRSNKVSVPSPSFADLVREGVLSDFKMRANRNLRAGLNSASNVSHAVRDWFPFSARK